MTTDSLKQAHSCVKLLLDLVFKFYFSGNKRVLLSLLKTFLPIPENTQIVDILNADSSIYPSAEDGKRIVLDLRIQLNSGEKINVEIQSISRDGFLSRVLFYWAKLYTEDLERGQEYKELCPTYSLIFTEFDVVSAAKGPVTSFSIRSDTPPHFNLNNHFNMVFVELSKFKKEGIKGLVDLQDYWCYLIKSSSQMTSTELAKLSQTHEDMRMAIDHLKTLSEDKKLRIQEELREKYIRDRKAEKSLALREGREEGIKEGMEKGMEKGKTEGIKEGMEKVVLGMLQKGLDLSLIQETSGLSQEKIKQIQEKNHKKVVV